MGEAKDNDVYEEDLLDYEEEEEKAPDSIAAKVSGEAVKSYYRKLRDVLIVVNLHLNHQAEEEEDETVSMKLANKCFMFKGRFLFSPQREELEEVVLTEANFEKEVGQDRAALVEFYAPWCGHYKKLAPEYEKLGSSFKKAKSVLIGKTFYHIVLDVNKDVLVEFYAPWLVYLPRCGHCKHLAPIYEKLANAYKLEDDVVIANLDADKYKDLA
ncbi:hypothetical protein ZIOFF_062251 [Zingiber officinale]|uniref:Thioredoxin domain-containing protein n=1 Tax=Zingiber officinale TaxID=94328 RepID=A0A8J5F046_ZINOF|nr:hypothetical protein ZIOFF_062251 [Zingiber officinale]